MPGVHEAMSAVAAAISHFHNDITNPIFQACHRFEELSRAATAPLVEAMQEAEKARPMVTSYLIDRGWYLTCHFPFLVISRLDSLIRVGKHGEVDAIMCALVCDSLMQVEERLRLRFPHRAPILTDAFEAHRGTKFTLSIPTFLAQIDGIGCEILGIARQFFAEKNRAKGVKFKLGSIIIRGKEFHLGGAKHAMLEPLLEKMSIAADTDERDRRRLSEPWFGPLNRHGVHHGLDVDYPTEENSLRCVTLLEHLLDADQFLNQEHPARLAKWKERLG